MPFTVKTEAFNGPLDLLLELIENRKLFINDISLAKVTDDFIEHINQGPPSMESWHGNGRIGPFYLGRLHAVADQI